MQYFYKTKTGGEAGPVSRQVLNQLMLAGEIKSGTLVRTDNTTDWMPYSSIKEVAVADSTQETKEQIRAVKDATAKGAVAVADAAAEAMTQAANKVSRIKLGPVHWITAGITLVLIALVWVIPVCLEIANKQPGVHPYGAVYDALCAQVRVDRETLPASNTKDMDVLPMLPTIAAPVPFADGTSNRFLTEFVSITHTYEAVDGNTVVATINVCVKAKDDIVALGKELSGAMESSADRAFYAASLANRDLAAGNRVVWNAKLPVSGELKFKKGQVFTCIYKVPLRKALRDWGFGQTLKTMFTKSRWYSEGINEQSCTPAGLNTTLVLRSAVSTNAAIIGDSSYQTVIDEWQSKRKAFVADVATALKKQQEEERVAEEKRQEEERQRPFRQLELAQKSLADQQAKLRSMDEAIKAGEGGVEGASRLIAQRRTQENVVQRAEYDVTQARENLNSILKNQFANDYAAFRTVETNANVPQALKLKAWAELVEKWKLPYAANEPKPLIWKEGKPDLARGSLRIDLGGRWPDRFKRPTIFIDHEAVGWNPNYPAVFQGSTYSDLAVGRHTLRVEHASVMPFESEFEIRFDNTTTVTWTPNLRPPVVQVAVAPADVAWSAFLNGKKLEDVNNPMKLQVEAQTNYQLKVVASGFEAKIYTINVDYGSNDIITITLDKTPVPEEGKSWSISELNLTLMPIAPGTFTMGSPKTELGHAPGESPQHQVTLSKAFWLGCTEVTQTQWKMVMGNDPSKFSGMDNNLPVENITWNEAVEFCRKVTKIEQAQGRLPGNYKYCLPTEAQWEYACRAGTTAMTYAGDFKVIGKNNTPDLDKLAWYGGNSGVNYSNGIDSSTWLEKQYGHNKAGTHPVAMKTPNAWGLHDMLGNVSEWCADWVENYPEGNVIDPQGLSPHEANLAGRVLLRFLENNADASTKDERRIVRGSAYNFLPTCLRSAYRAATEPGVKLHSTGLRLCLVKTQ